MDVSSWQTYKTRRVTSDKTHDSRAMHNRRCVISQKIHTVYSFTDLYETKCSHQRASQGGGHVHGCAVSADVDENDIVDMLRASRPSVRLERHVEIVRRANRAVLTGCSWQGIDRRGLQ